MSASVDSVQAVQHDSSQQSPRSAQAPSQAQSSGSKRPFAGMDVLAGSIVAAPRPAKKGPKPLRRRARKPSATTAMSRNTAVSGRSHRTSSKNPSPSDVRVYTAE
jgi:hypothetical protein